jgi:hypothetical protein
MAPRVLNLASKEDRLVESHPPQHTPGEKNSLLPFDQEAGWALVGIRTG